MIGNVHKENDISICVSRFLSPDIDAEADESSKTVKTFNRSES